jgi:hypothetical protein
LCCLRTLVSQEQRYRIDFLLKTCLLAFCGSLDSAMGICDRCIGIPVFARQYKHQPDFASLQASAESCDLCRLLVHVLEKSGQRTAAEEYRVDTDQGRIQVNDTSVTISETEHHPAAGSRPKQASHLAVTCGPTTLVNARGVSRNAPAVVLGIYADEGTAPCRNSPRDELWLSSW